MARIALLLMTAVLAACSTLAPEYQRPALPVASSYPGSTDAAAAAPIGWREFFIDRRLQTLIKQAFANNRDLRVAALNIEGSSAARRRKPRRAHRKGVAPPDDMRQADHIEHGRRLRRKSDLAPLLRVMETPDVERRASRLPLRFLHCGARALVILLISVSLLLLFVLWSLAQLTRER
jgi:hypothetical protein